MDEEIKCPQCNELTEGTTYLWEIGVTAHQCKNGHMWDENDINKL